jgi:hypothetical protein
VLPQDISGDFKVSVDGLVNADSDKPLDFELLVEVNSSVGGAVATGTTILTA